MRRYKIFGPPGTGKTTYLLKKLEEEFKKTRPENCAFVSFTRKGTYEGVERAKARFTGLTDNDFRFFKTIHALCFSEAGTRRYEMMQPRHYKQFGDKLGLKFLGFYTEEFQSNNDQYLFASQLRRNNPEAAEKFEINLNAKKLNWVNINYLQYKKQLELLDFTDLLEIYLEKGRPLPVTTAFVDEAQDLTPLQWSVVLKMFSNCDKLFVAGDDDQAIYEWSGADVNKFLSFEGTNKVLNQSYRLPDKVLSYSNKITERISNRKRKKIFSSGVSGELFKTTSWSEVEFSAGTLVLARNNCFLSRAEKELRERGLFYSRKGTPSVDLKTIKAIYNYEAYRRDELKKKDLGLYMPFFKTLDQKDKPWFEVLNRKAYEIDYYRSLFANKTNLDHPSVSLETIHSAKGSESDHVVLLHDVTKGVNSNMHINPDSELRCLYVGATRAKRKLTLLLPSTKHVFPVL